MGVFEELVHFIQVVTFWCVQLLHLPVFESFSLLLWATSSVSCSSSPQLVTFSAWRAQWIGFLSRIPCTLCAFSLPHLAIVILCTWNTIQLQKNFYFLFKDHSKTVTYLSYFPLNSPRLYDLGQFYSGDMILPCMKVLCEYELMSPTRLWAPWGMKPCVVLLGFPHGPWP